MWEGNSLCVLNVIEIIKICQEKIYQTDLREWISIIQWNISQLQILIEQYNSQDNSHISLYLTSSLLRHLPYLQCCWSGRTESLLSGFLNGILLECPSTCLIPIASCTSSMASSSTFSWVGSSPSASAFLLLLSLSLAGSIWRTLTTGLRWLLDHPITRRKRKSPFITLLEPSSAASLDTSLAASSWLLEFGGSASSGLWFLRLDAWSTWGTT